MSPESERNPISPGVDSSAGPDPRRSTERTPRETPPDHEGEERPHEAESERATGSAPDADPGAETLQSEREEEWEAETAHGWIAEKIRGFREKKADFVDHLKLWHDDRILERLSRKEQDLQRPGADLSKYEGSLTELQAQAERHGFELDEHVIDSYHEQRARLEEQAERRAEQLREVTERKAEFEERRTDTVERMAGRWEESLARTRERRVEDESELTSLRDIAEHAHANAAILTKDIATLESHRSAMEDGPFRDQYQTIIKQQKERLGELETQQRIARTEATKIEKTLKERKQKERELQTKVDRIRGKKPSEKTKEATGSTENPVSGETEQREAESRSFGDFVESWNKRSAFRVTFDQHELDETADRDGAIERIRDHLRNRLNRKMYDAIDTDIKRFEKTL